MIVSLTCSPRADTALRYLAWAWPSCLALDLSLCEGRLTTITLPEQPDQAEIPSLWVHLVPATGIFLLPNHLSPLPWVLLFLQPNKSGITSSTQQRQLCLYFSFGSFAYKVFYSHIFSLSTIMESNVCSRIGTRGLSVCLYLSSYHLSSIIYLSHYPCIHPAMSFLSPTCS